MLIGRIIHERELEHLGDLLSHLMFLRESGKPVIFLHQTVKDLRRLIQRVINNYYMDLDIDQEYQFFSEISDFLYEVQEDLIDIDMDEEFCNYCVNKVISAFKQADKIKYGTAVISDDLPKYVPILEQFDLKLRPMMRLVKS